MRDIIIISIFKCLPLLAFLLTSCEKVDLNELEYNDSENTLSIITRSASDIEYPITLIVFNENGNAVESSIIESNSNNTSLALSAGKYHIIAISGIKECDSSKFSSLEDVITLPKSNNTTVPIQMGSTDILITQNATATITLYNQVAALDLSLTDIPENVNEVSVSLSVLNNKINLLSQCTGNVSTSVDLTRQTDGTWTSPRFYTLPSSSDKLTISITTKSSNGQETFGYTHKGAIKSNTPYSLNGSFKKGFSINSIITVAGWDKPEEISFTFGDNNNNESNNDESGNIRELPEIGSIWDNHFVGAIEYFSESSADIILLSLSEWSGITSAYNSEIPNMANDIAESYTEEGLKDWKIPTKDEIKIIRSSIGFDNIEQTNSILTDNNYTPLKYGEDIENDATIRYLCEDGKYSYAWDVNSTTKAGSKRTYHLRLINRINVEIIPAP